MKKHLFKYLLAFFFFFLVNTGIAQRSKKYKKETLYFLNSIRFNIRLFNIDTIRVLNYLSNTGLYEVMVLAGDDWAKGHLGNNDRNYLIKISKDTARYILPANSVEKAILVPYKKEQNYIQFSKPIFYKNYTVCIFSFGRMSEDGSQSTYLFKKINSKWYIITKIGGYYNY